MTTDIEPATPEHPSRRRVMECASWIGAGLVWTLAGGVPTTLAMLGEASGEAARFTFLQISDSHIRFKAPAYPDVPGTLDPGDRAGPIQTA